MSSLVSSIGFENLGEFCIINKFTKIFPCMISLTVIVFRSVCCKDMRTYYLDILGHLTNLTV